MLNTLISPLRSGVLLALLLLLAWRWLPRWARIFTAIPLIVCILLGLPTVANPLVRWQESRMVVAPECDSDPASTIVVLGGGISRRPNDASDFSALGESSIRRLFSGIERYKRQVDASVVISGGAAQYAIAESTLMARLAQEMGVRPDAIRLEVQSRSTWQNAEFVAAMDPAVGRRIWLVTSALHMPRASYAFAQAGFQVCAWPADPLAAEANGVGYYLPSTTALRKSEAVIHEWVGEAAYRMGWLRSATRDPWSSGDER